MGGHVLLIIGGGIAAYKALEVIRRLAERGMGVTPVLTPAGARFVTPLSVAAIAKAAVHQELFDLTAEAQMGHIELSRAADVVAVVPATADLMARMAAGIADDLATTLLLATDRPVLLAPAMNVRMWLHPATQRNLTQLQADGITVIGPDAGDMACGDYGPGRLSEPPAIVAAIEAAIGTARPSIPLTRPDGPLAGRHVLVTSGPTHEPIDPVRYIANRSSGAQGTAIAAALVAQGAEVTFVTGPAEVPPPRGVRLVQVETARQMLAAVEAALPAEVAIFAAAVADWQVEGSAQKIKKGAGGPPVLHLAENPDILAHVARHATLRPRLVVGFAAETEEVLSHARAKRLRKGCDWIVANDVSPATGIMGGAENAVTVIDETGEETWDRLSKAEVGTRLAARIARALT